MPHMYLDVLGLITTGIGNLIDPLSAALVLPWKRADGSLATQGEIANEWNRLKGRQDLKTKHYREAGKLCELHLDDADIAALVDRKLDENARFLTKTFPFFASFPADGQLGILSMAWAVGPAFTRKFPKFTTHVLAGDWLRAREECDIDATGNPGVIPRNGAQKVCFYNAAMVVSLGLPRDELYWPAPVRKEAHAPDPAERDTMPDVDPPAPRTAADAMADYYERTERMRQEGLDEMSERIADTDPSELAPESEGNS
ncbi:MAG TPA: hypothetical protein VGK73_33315 [Polyangiaceae bacterium]